MILRERLLRALVAARARDGRCALATVLDTRGSTPRGTGARMLVDLDAGLTGSVGGGCGEAEVIAAARRVVESGEPVRVHVDLTHDLMSWSPAVCGGIMEIYVEPV